MQMNLKNFSRNVVSDKYFYIFVRHKSFKNQIRIK